MPNSHDNIRRHPDGTPASPCRGWILETCHHGNVRLIPLFCHRWDCAICAPALKAQVTARLCEAHRQAQPQNLRLRLITLTYKEDVTPRFLHLSLQRLVSMLRKRFGLFEYARFPEYTERGRLHLHLVAFTHFIPQQDLSEYWDKASQGSYIVDIRLVKSASHLAHYVTKYLSKAPAAKVTYSRRFPGARPKQPPAICPVCGDKHFYRRCYLEEASTWAGLTDALWNSQPIMNGPPCSCWTQDEKERWQLCPF